MKKLMIAAAAAAMIGGAYATDVCTDEDVGSWDTGCLVYDLQIKVKTLAPKKLKCKGDGCSDCGSTLYYLDNASRKFKGYIWFCNDYCWDVNDTPYIVLWDANTKTPVVPILYQKYVSDTGVKGTKYFYEQDGLEFTFLGRYAKSANKVAAAWTLDTEDIAGYAAGVNGTGILDKDDNTLMLKSISGNFAGLALPSATIKSKCEANTVYGLIAELCDCFDAWCEGSGEEWDEGVPATGTWSLKYNKKLSNGSTPMFKLAPKYALVDEDAV